MGTMVAGFDPVVSGFGWIDKDVLGGMVFAALDLFTAGRRPRSRSTPPSPATPTADYLARRQADADRAGGEPPALPPGRRWAAIRAELDAGVPCPIVVEGSDPVLALGYDHIGSDVTLYVYDPRHPGQIHPLGLNRSRPDLRLLAYAPEEPPESRDGGGPPTPLMVEPPVAEGTGPAGPELQLLSVGDHRILEWHSDAGTYQLWRYVPNRPDRLFSGPPLAFGTWPHPADGHRLVWLGGAHLLEWDPPSGRYWMWPVDLTADRGAMVATEPSSSGAWASIGEGRDIVYLGDPSRTGHPEAGPRVLDRHTETGRFRVWRHEPSTAGDPLPGQAVAGGIWAARSEPTRLAWIGGTHVVEWEQTSGRVWHWRYDADEGAAEPFREIRPGRDRAGALEDAELIFVDDRLVEREPATARFRVWALDLMP